MIEDDQLYQTEHAKALTTDDALTFYGITDKEWVAIKNSVVEGAAKFWRRKGVKEPGTHTFEARMRGESEEAWQKAEWERRQV